jgi:hypothetical protein
VIREEVIAIGDARVRAGNIILLRNYDGRRGLAA